MGRTIAFVGAGNVARFHMDIVPQLPDADDLTVAAADPNPDARDAFAEEFPDAELYDDMETMLATPAEPKDIVVVAVPPMIHREAAIAGLESGRHVLCEKPLATSHEEAAAMYAAADDVDRLLGSCGCRFLGTPATERVKEVVASGDLGEIYHVTWTDRQQRARPGIEYQPESRWFLDSSKSGGGTLLDWGPYDFTTLNDVLAPEAIDVRDAWSANPHTEIDPADVVFDVDEHVGASLRYRLSDGATPTVSYERAVCTHGEERSVAEIEGTEGAVRWTWKDYGEETTVTVATDDAGEVTERTEQFTDDRGPKSTPLWQFDRAIRGESAHIATNERALFNFASLTAIGECAETEEPRRVTRDG